MRIGATALFIGVLLLSKPSIAQTYELGLQFGAANYQGDLAPSIAYTEFRQHVGIYGKKNLNGYFSYKAALNYGLIGGDDSNFDHLSPRNLNFRSNIFEASLQLEFNFREFAIGLRSKDKSPYVATGISLFYFNPQAQLNGTWHNLRPLSTEGQGIGGGSPYSLLAPSIPLVGGHKWLINDSWRICTYLGYRFTFTDYLDDVSGNYFDNNLIFERRGDIAAQLADRTNDNVESYSGKERGNNDRNDWYFFVGFSVFYAIPDKVCFQF